MLGRVKACSDLPTGLGGCIRHPKHELSFNSAIATKRVGVERYLKAVAWLRGSFKPRLDLKFHPTHRALEARPSWSVLRVAGFLNPVKTQVKVMYSVAFWSFEILIGPPSRQHVAARGHGGGVMTPENRQNIALR